jgi:hypothetical protein
VEEQAEMGLTDGLIRFSIGQIMISREQQMMRVRMVELYIIIFLGGSNLIKIRLRAILSGFYKF